MRDHKNGNRHFSWFIAGLGILINTLYFFFEYIVYGGSILSHFTELSIEHLTILSFIPLFIYVAWLVEKKSVLQRELERYSKGLEETVKERTAELEESNRLKDLFSDIMTHDLLNPLGVISNAVQLELDNRPDDKYLLIAQSNLQRAVNLIRNAHKYSKLSSGEDLEVKEQDITRIMEKAVQDITPRAREKGMTIDYRRGKSYTAPVNPIMEDVFVNLLSNAVKYSPEKSTIKVRVLNGDGTLKVSVKDSGPGIPDDEKRSVFERFQRVYKGGVKGTGLGLAIVKKAVELHKGRVWIEDNPGGGSIFNVELPRSLN